MESWPNWMYCNYSTQYTKQTASKYGSDDTQVHNGTNDTVSDHIGTVKESPNDHSLSSRSTKIPITRKNYFFIFNPTLGLECIVHTIQIETLVPT